MIKLSSPEIPESAISLAVDILRSGNLVQGKHVLELEKRLAEYLGTAECICVSSGTAALHLAIISLDLPAGAEAIVPGFTFPATANAAEVSRIHTNFADIRLDDCCIDPAELEKAWNPAVKVIIPVHEFGQSADMDPILAFAKEKNLFVLWIKKMLPVHWEQNTKDKNAERLALWVVSVFTPEKPLPPVKADAL